MNHQQIETLPYGLRYIGEQDDARGGTFALFHDPLTGTTFTPHAGETFQEALMRKRGEFQEVDRCV